LNCLSSFQKVHEQLDMSFIKPLPIRSRLRVAQAGLVSCRSDRPREDGNCCHNLRCETTGPDSVELLKDESLLDEIGKVQTVCPKHYVMVMIVRTGQLLYPTAVP